MPWNVLVLLLVNITARSSVSEMNKLEKQQYLSGKYGNIAYTPLDIPEIRPDSWQEFWKIWNAERDFLERQWSDRNNVGTKHWLGMEIWGDPKAKERAWAMPFSQHMKDANPCMMSIIKEHMPFKQIGTVRLWRSVEEIWPHREGNPSPYLHPMEVRVMLADNNPVPTFYLIPVQDRVNADQESARYLAREEGERLYMDPPKENNAFVFNCETCYHGSDFDPNHAKILMVINGTMDLKRYDELMSRSIKKFENQVIRVEPTLY